MEYHPGIIFRSAHVNTCYPTFFRKIDIEYCREEIETPDGDFFHVDWVKKESSNLVVLCHGVEGSSYSKYMKGMAKYFSERGWDVAAINARSCSGVMNRLLKTYHMGFIEDLDYFLAVRGTPYKRIVLVGFSMGANVVLNFAGNEKVNKKNVMAIAAVSPPCHLVSSSSKLETFWNYLYTKQFLDSLKRKAFEKSKLFPKEINYERIARAKSLWEFDDFFTAPVNGFENARDYYEKSSSIYILDKIDIPTLILTPLDDPMMGEECYPFKECAANHHITFECPEYGGHVGFSSFTDYPYWHEERIASFVRDIIRKGE